jgi:L-ascorbate metabolism protein UlaG (beta-lactamase superfamily)
MGNLNLIRQAASYCIFLLALTSCSNSNWVPDPKLFLKESKVTNTELNVKYFGATSLYITDGETDILVDGFFTRQSLFESLVNGITSNDEQIKNTLKQGGIDKIDALLISHAHYDHILDAPMLGANKVYGSPQAKKRFSNDSFVDVIDGDSKVVGKFKITFFETDHVEKKWYVKFLEFIHLFLARGTSYLNSGKNYSFLIEHLNGNILIVPSANVRPNQYNDVKADIVFLGVGLLSNNGDAKQYIINYWEETVGKTGAKIVVPIHWDPFNKPIANPISPSPAIIDNLKLTMGELKRLAKESKVSIRLLPVITNTIPIKRNDG